MTQKPLSSIALYKNRCEASFRLSLPHRGRGTASAVDRVLSSAVICVKTFSICIILFHTACALSAPAGHLPLEGKATIREYPLLKDGAVPLWLIRSPVSSSLAQPRDLYCTAAICTHALSLKRHLGASFFAFPSLTVYRSARRIPPLRSG